MFGIGQHVLMASTNIASTKAASAISGLVSSSSAWIAGLGAAGGGLMIGYHALMRNFSGGDAQTDAHHLAGMKKVIVGTAIVVGAGSLAHFAGGLF